MMKCQQTTRRDSGDSETRSGNEQKIDAKPRRSENEETKRTYKTRT